MSIEVIGSLKNRPKAGSGAPSFNNDRPVHIIYVDDLEPNGYPQTDEKGVRTISDFVFKPGKYADKAYFTGSSKDYTADVDGDADAERFKLKVVANRPGDETEATEYAVNNLGRPFILVAGKCEMGAKSKIIGDICAPLYLKPSFQANNDKTGFVFTYEQSSGSRNMHRDYSGTLPTEDNLRPTQAATAIQFLSTNVNSVSIAVGTAASTAKVTSVTKGIGEIVTLVGQDLDPSKAATLASTLPAEVATESVIVLLKNGVAWTSVSGATISFRIHKDATKTYLIETSRS